jgi:hypothetical protein
MISCESFRSRFVAGTDDPALLEHLRDCDRCLDRAAHLDPDVMFRAIGGGELVPPGGLDAFVDDVMQQVRVRTAETTVEAKNVVSWPRRLAVAATLAAGLTGAMLYRSATNGVVAPSHPMAKPIAIDARLRPKAARPALATKAVVETYDSENATIVELPAEETGDDVKIVMIFDENLPADL